MKQKIPGSCARKKPRYAYIVYAVKTGASLETAESVGIDRNAGKIVLSDGTIAPDVDREERRRKASRE